MDSRKDEEEGFLPDFSATSFTRNKGAGLPGGLLGILRNGLTWRRRRKLDSTAAFPSKSGSSARITPTQQPAKPAWQER